MPSLDPDTEPSAIVCRCPCCGQSHYVRHTDEQVAGWARRYVRGESQKDIALGLGYRTPSQVHVAMNEFLQNYNPGALSNRAQIAMDGAIRHRREALRVALENYERLRG